LSPKRILKIQASRHLPIALTANQRRKPKKANANEKVIERIKKANTARHVSEIIQENKVKGFFELICSETYKQMRKHSEEKVPIDVILFDFDGSVLARKSEE